MNTGYKLALLFFLCASATFAQNSLVSIPPTFLGPAAAPRLGANLTITFCTSAATGVPCSPLAQAYSDSTNSFPINQSTNPLKTDALGNAPVFYAAPGQYSYTITGPGLAAPQGPFQVFAPCVPGVSCVATSANNTFTGNNTFSSGTTTISNLAGPTAVTGNNTHSGTETFTNALTAVALDGCQHVNASQTFAAALAAASTPGCIAVDPGTYTVSANAAIPATVMLVSQSGGLLSIATGVTLTINGQIVAPGVQIFAYVGTGVVAINNTGYPIFANWFPGADLAVQGTAAYTAVSSGATITAASQTACYAVANSFNFSTIGKRITFAGQGPSGATNGVSEGGLCINDTRTGGTSFTIVNSPTGATESGSTVTITCTATCTGGSNIGVGTYVNITGVGVAGYNIASRVATTPGSPGTTFTIPNPWFTSLAASGGGTVQIMPVTVYMDWENPAANGTFGPGQGMREISFISGATNCQTQGGCGNATVGIAIGDTNGGAQSALILNVKTTGYGVGRMISSGAGWQEYFQNNTCAQDTTCFENTTAVEGVTFDGGTCVNSANCFYTNTTDFHLSKYHVDGATIMGIQCANGTVQGSHIHFENFGTNNTHFVNGSCNLEIEASTAGDDCTGAISGACTGATTDYWFTTTSDSTIWTAIGSAGRTPTNLAVCSGACDYIFLNSNIAALPEANLCPSSNGVSCKDIVNSTNVVHTFLPTATVKGTLLGGDGAFGVPGIGFTAQSTTGWFRPAGGVIEFSLAGSDGFLATATEVRHPNNGRFTWSSNAESFNAAADTGLSRDAAGVVDVGTGAQGNSAGSLKSASLIAGGSAAGLTGTGACATITTQTGGAWAGRATCTGTTGASTFVIAPGTTAPNGWVCSAFDETTRANLLQQTATLATNCTLTATSITANDVIVFRATAF